MGCSRPEGLQLPQSNIRPLGASSACLLLQHAKSRSPPVCSQPSKTDVFKWKHCMLKRQHLSHVVLQQAAPSLCCWFKQRRQTVCGNQSVRDGKHRRVPDNSSTKLLWRQATQHAAAHGCDHRYENTAQRLRCRCNRTICDCSSLLLLKTVHWTV